MYLNYLLILNQSGQYASQLHPKCYFSNIEKRSHTPRCSPNAVFNNIILPKCSLKVSKLFQFSYMALQLLSFSECFNIYFFSLIVKLNKARVLKSFYDIIEIVEYDDLQLEKLMKIVLQLSVRKFIVYRRNIIQRYLEIKDT